ncbi:MAG TPA: bifunctional diguanylate cyclase/phosphodiesterase [Burkholderiaceae bacterium]|nr:bifunctional diguanylate cyclase/phosphodiesterase [Burkholderiaceae bacterium]
MWIELHAGMLVALALVAALIGALVAIRRQRSRLASQPQPAETARVDPVTGLPSRAVFDERLEVALTQAESQRSQGSVLYAGLDGFRLVNDRHGHEFGDEVLRLVAERLRAHAGVDVLMCRVAGDEFALWIDGPAVRAEELAQHLVDSFKAPMQVPPHSIALALSVGVALFPEHGSRSRIVTRAGAAMRAVKLQGGHAYAVFNPAVAAAEREELQLARDLKGAVKRSELALYYQPKIDAASLQVTAAEALLRWSHPTRGVITPDYFIPLAERHGLIAEIGEWVLDEALRQAAAWRKQGLRMRVAVNVSGVQMRSEEFAVRLARGLKSHGLNADRFTCEITESVAMEDTAVTRRAFERLGQLGVHVSIDDFGTGHSSLASLRKLPTEELKIDRAFVIDLEESVEARTIVQAIVQMAHTLGLRVVAEGVETEAQRDVLVSMGVEELQGYLFAKPMSASALGLWARNSAADLSRTFKASLFTDTQTTEIFDEDPRPATGRG